MLTGKAAELPPGASNLAVIDAGSGRRQFGRRHCRRSNRTRYLARRQGGAVPFGSQRWAQTTVDCAV